MISMGVDPAFDYNFGKVSTEKQAMKVFQDKVNAMPPELKAAFFADPKVKELLAKLK
jgi:hypothetical protein